jgi:hypothetical protein
MLKFRQSFVISLLALTTLPIVATMVAPAHKAQALCAAPTQLTGIWQANDGGTYYVRQTGNQVWWLGMSSDQGKTWTNVFKGTRNGNTISGTWADVPKGKIQSGGTLNLTLQTSGGNGILGFKKGTFTGGFGGSQWSQPCDDVILNPVKE